MWFIVASKQDKKNCCNLKSVICCVNKVKVASLIPYPKAVALPTHADWKVAAWQRYLRTTGGEGSIKRGPHVLRTFFNFLPAALSYIASVWSSDKLHTYQVQQDMMQQGIFEIKHLAFWQLDGKNRLWVNFVKAALAGTFSPVHPLNWKLKPKKSKLKSKN